MNSSLSDLLNRTRHSSSARTSFRIKLIHAYVMSVSAREGGSHVAGVIEWNITGFEANKQQKNLKVSLSQTGVPLVPFQESRGVPAREVLRESAQSPKSFDAHSLRSKLSSYDLKLLRERCEIPPTIKLRLPDENESANMTTLDEIGVYWDMFINGFRVPLHPFVIRVLKVYGLAPDQFSPHAWRFMSSFIYQCYKLGFNPRVGWYFLSRRPKAEANLFPHPPSSNHLWKERFLFVRLPKSQRSEVNNVWLPECETRACNKLKEVDLTETDLEHIGKLKGAKPLESRYPLSNDQLRECGIIYSPEPQDLVDEEDEEEEGENDPSKALTKF
ncbi:hypothetical protein RJ639_002791 [Escallonia herrerae]|uniref:Transposase (putative) gypsy type domain-containing protein n=1 Tax=Escallonia herrerae TaxID=1293975 RepID=A0AA88W766_9ASTE|nr:hypothetical protein RJ639_002791 [Escallonia herrerae]